MKNPTIDTQNINKDYGNNDDEFTRKTAIPQDKILNPVSLALTTIWYFFNSQFYRQPDGVTMGRPASSITSEKRIQAHEQNAISTALDASLMTFTSFLNVRTWKTTFPSTSTIFIKRFSLLWRKEEMENLHFLILN